MSVNGKANKVTILKCSQCCLDIILCDNCDEKFNEGDFVSCGDDDKHICEQCYEDFGPKAINEEQTYDRN